jgi:hypothetical protein
MLLSESLANVPWLLYNRDGKAGLIQVWLSHRMVCCAVLLPGLGMTLAAKGDGTKARPLLRRSLGLLKRALGAQHPLTIKAAAAQMD